MTQLLNISEAASLGLHAMALLARSPKQRYTNQQIAEMLSASEHHLAKVMQRLVKARMVESARGPQGGFLLSGPAEKMTLLAVYEAVEGSLENRGCLLSHPICDGKNCVLGEVLQAIHQQICDYLDQTTLAELAQGLGLATTLERAKRNDLP